MNFFRSIFNAVFKSRKSRKVSKTVGANRANVHHPTVEGLEDRCLLSSTSIGSLAICTTTTTNTTSSLTNCATTTTQNNCTTVSTTACQTTASTCSTQTSCSCPTISGYVYYDANNNGLMDPGEQPLANTPIELVNSQGTIIGNAVTNAAGYYQFNEDDTVSTAVQTITKTLSFPATQTDYSLSGLIGQFDPSLGTLVSVSITNCGSITSDIKVENTSTNSASTITGTVGGNLILTGPNGLTLQTTLSQEAGSFHASVYDGQLNFSGSSGDDFGNKTANGASTATVTGSGLTAFIGTGNVELTQTALATSTASGGGNLLVGVCSTATAQVTVVYSYIPSDCLKPGCYTIVKTSDPAGYNAGKESSNGVVLTNPPAPNVIPVTLTCGNSCNNDFAELKASCLSGYVYADTSTGGFNDGVMEPDEAGISGVTVTLMGTTSQGTVNLTATTNAAGFYQFKNLQPGTYEIIETHPAGWVDGKDTPGNSGGGAGQDEISNIKLPAGTQGANYNFGELQYSELGGSVFYDGGAGNYLDNGQQDPGEPGIANVTVQLTGTDADGNWVSLSTTTDSNGHYLFNNLVPGSYAVADVQPAPYIAGKNSVGNVGGQQTVGGFANIFLAADDAALNYNFAELLPSSISGYVYVDTSNAGYNDGIKEANEAGLAGVTISLTGTNDQGAVNVQATTDSTGAYSFAGLRPGTYTLTESPPAGYIDGKDTLGAITTGQVGKDQLSNIVLPPNATDPNNNFGELSPSVRVYLVPPLVPGITPNAPVFATPPIPVVSKSQLLSSSINKTANASTADNAQFINSVYTSVLGRTVDSAGLSSWLNYLQGGGTRQGFVAGILNSAEHRTDEVKSIYQSIFGTAPSQATVNAYVAVFNSGGSEFTVAADIAGSAQATNLFPTTAAYVNELYQLAMGRTASPSEQATWAAFTGSRTALALAILTTPEALTDVIQQSYSQLLNRAPSSTELNLWIGQIQSSNGGFNAMLESLFTSAEYAARLTI